MEQLSYSFIITMLHSTWQMALLLGMSYILFAAGNKSPLAKRNILQVSLLAQVFVSIGTFYYSYQNYQQDANVFLTLGLTETLNPYFLRKYAPIIFLCYSLVASYKIVIKAGSWYRFTFQYQQYLQKAPPALKLFTQAKAMHFGIKRKVTIWCSTNINSPVTFGFFKPVILMPLALLNSITTQQAEALILHELNHIKQHDYLYNWLLVIAESLFFFNPFVKIAASQIRIEREKTCDLQVLHFKYPTIIYAEALLKTAQFQQQQLSLQLSAVNNKKQLLQRIHFFSKAENQVSFKNKSINAIALLSFAVLINMLLVVSVSWQQNRPAVAGTPALFLPGSYKQPLNNEQRGSFKTAPVAFNFSSQAEEPVPVIKTEVEVKSTSIEKNIEAPASLAARDVNIAEQDEPAIYSMPVAMQEIFLNSKEVIITEESTDGKKVTIALKATFINGEWVMVPLWMSSEQDAKSDSSRPAIKDSVIRLIPTVQ